MCLSDRGKQILLVFGLAGAFLLICLAGLGAPRATADARPAAPAQNYVGINGAPCNYPDVINALIAATDGDTIYVSDVTSTTHTGLIGRIEHDLTFVAATDNCQTKSGTQAYLDGGGGSWAPSGGLAVISSTKTVTFTFIRLQNAHAFLRGGIVYVEPDARLVLEDSHILDGEAGRYGGGAYVSQGGQLLMSASLVDTNEVTQTGISLGGGGGVYVNGGIMTMTNYSRIGTTGTGHGNTSAQDGGGIYLDGGSLYVHDSWVLNNLAVEGGGGIMAVNGASISVDGSSLIGADTTQNPSFTNYAGDGGGLYLDGGSGLTVKDQARVMWNSAVDTGGGIYATHGSYVVMNDDAQVYSNTATFGGGCFLTGTNTILSMTGSNVTIEGNRAIAPIGPGTVANGGGVLVTAEAGLYAVGGRFIGNSADLAGGGVYVAQYGAPNPTMVDFQDGVEVSNNIAPYGGGMYLAGDGSRVTVDGSQIYANYAITQGGGIRIFGNTILALRRNSVISGNAALNGHGGGLAMQDGQVSISDSLLQSNQAGLVTLPGSNGGGIHQSGGGLTIVNSSLMGNTGYAGGGLNVDQATAVLTNVKVTSNYADQGGGGIYVTSGDLIMDAAFGPECTPAALPSHTYCSEVRGNGSSGVGAGIYVGAGQSTATIAHTAFLDNLGVLPTHGSDGEAMWLAPDANVSVKNCLFTGHGTTTNTMVYVDNNASYFSDNSTYAGNQYVPLFVDSQGAVTLTLNILWDNGGYANIQGSLSSQCNDSQAWLGGPGDINADPRFITLRGPYRLGPGSPAIDTCIGFTDYDLDGKPRPINAHGGQTLYTYDMGAFEARPPVFLPLVLRNY